MLNSVRPKGPEGIEDAEVRILITIELTPFGKCRKLGLACLRILETVFMSFMCRTEHCDLVGRHYADKENEPRAQTNAKKKKRQAGKSCE